MMLFNHGISAFGANIRRDYHTIVERTLEIASGKHPDWELSCSREDQYLGPIGFTCTGRCIEMYDCNCCSHIDDNTGHRVSSPSMVKNHKCDEARWYESLEITEAFVSEVHIVGFWMEKGFYKEYLRNKNRNSELNNSNKSKMFLEVEKLLKLFPKVKIISEKDEWRDNYTTLVTVFTVEDTVDVIA